MKLFLEQFKVSDDSLDFYNLILEHLEHGLAILELGLVLLLGIRSLLELHRDVLEVHLQLVYYFMCFLLSLLLLSLGIHVV